MQGTAPRGEAGAALRFWGGKPARAVGAGSGDAERVPGTALGEGRVQLGAAAPHPPKHPSLDAPLRPLAARLRLGSVVQLPL